MRDPRPERVRASPGHSLSVLRAGDGGVPLMLLHGFPCTSRIWSRNIGPLAAAGFDVAAPDLRGYGDSDPAPDGFYDPAAFSADLLAVMDHLGWTDAVVVGHDLGAVVAIDLANRHPNRVRRLALLNHPTPALPEAYAAAGIPPATTSPAVFDYVLRQGRHTDELLSELSTPDRRQRYITEFYRHRQWCPAGAFSDEDLTFLTEPYRDADRLRAAFADYQVVTGDRPISAPDMFNRPVTQPVLVMLGPDDVTLPDCIADRCAVAYPDVVGPFFVPGTGHYLQWERPEVLNRTLRWYCGDLLPHLYSPRCRDPLTT